VIKKIQNIKSIKKVHLIAPSVWAYREGRAKKISKLYDLLLAILPFEPPYFEKYGLKTIFIGHPIIEKNPDFSNANFIKENFRKINKIESDDFLLCLTPGSRNSEVKKIFPEMIKAVNELYHEKTNLKIAIPIVKKTQELVRSLSNKINAPHLIIEDQEQKNSLYLSSDFAITKSGTNTIEFSLYKIPIIICYKVNLLTYLILKTLIKIKYANLLNLILNREIIPELLQNDCNSQNIHKELKRFIDDKNLSIKQINDTQKALEMIGLNSNISASKKACNAIFDLLKK
jgi:lipid-A-disaccharide synthase